MQNNSNRDTITGTTFFQGASSQREPTADDHVFSDDNYKSFWELMNYICSLIALK